AGDPAVVPAVAGTVAIGGRQFPLVRFDQVVVRALSAHRGGEVAGAAADVHHGAAGQWLVVGQLPDGVLGEHRVEVFRGGLFDQKGPEQPDGASDPTTVGARHTGTSSAGSTVRGGVSRAARISSSTPSTRQIPPSTR